MSEGGPTRRAALAGLVGVAGSLATTTACLPFGAEEKKPTPDEVIRDRVLAGKRALLGRYRATLERYPALRPKLAPLAAEHEAHLRALSPPGTAGTPGESGSTATPGGSGSPAAPAVPATTAAALAGLAAAERAAAKDRIADVLGASPRLARVLAAMGGCEAGHAELLRPSS